MSVPPSPLAAPGYLNSQARATHPSCEEAKSSVSFAGTLTFFFIIVLVSNSASCQMSSLCCFAVSGRAGNRRPSPRNGPIMRQPWDTVTTPAYRSAGRFPAAPPIGHLGPISTSSGSNRSKTGGQAAPLNNSSSHKLVPFGTQQPIRVTARPAETLVTWEPNHTARKLLGGPAPQLRIRKLVLLQLVGDPSPSCAAVQHWIGLI